MYRLSLVLIDAGYTVPGSADGSTFSQSGVNKWVSATVADTTGAWIRLQDPAGIVEHEFQCISTASFAWRVSATSKFTGGSPSATVAPTATDQQFIFGTSATTGQAFATNGAYRINIVAGDSTWGYSFALFCNLTGVNTAAGGGLIYDGGLSGPSGDTAPFVCYGHMNIASFATPTDLSAYALSSAGGAGAWLNYAGTGAIWQEMQALQVSASALTFACWPPAAVGMGTNPQTGDDDLIPVLWGCSSGSGLTGLKGFKGFSKFLSMDGTSGRAHGTIVLVGSQNYCMLNGATSNGYICIPWPNGTAPLA
jgi:hypothetical protein